MHKELNVIYLNEIDSTNKYALREFADLPDASLIVAGYQSAGRGRHERQWVSPPDTNIYASLVIKDPGQIPALSSMIVSLAVLAALRECAPDLRFWLKWPNDVFCRERKIAGILCETASAPGQTVAGVVAGMGINVNMPAEIINSIDQPASSLMYETGKEFNLKKILKKLAKSLNKYYSIYSISPKVLLEYWKDENILLGQTVEINDGQKDMKVTIIDLGNYGELIVESDGQVKKLFSGDVRINKNSIDFKTLGLE